VKFRKKQDGKGRVGGGETRGETMFYRPGKRRKLHKEKVQDHTQEINPRKRVTESLVANPTPQKRKKRKRHWFSEKEFREGEIATRGTRKWSIQTETAQSGGCYNVLMGRRKKRNCGGKNGRNRNTGIGDENKRFGQGP